MERGFLQKRKRKIKRIPYLFISPFFFIFIFFFLYPAFYSLYLSLTKFSGFGSPRFVGIENYRILFQYDFFWQAVANTFFYVIAGIVPGITLSFLLAVLIHSRYVKWKTFYKICIYLPQTLATVAASLIFIVILGTNTGVINSLFHTRIPFLENPEYTRWAVVAVITWRGIGWYLLIYLAGLSNIDTEVIESARIDGANAFGMLLKITIPLMRPIFSYTIVIGTINSLKIYTEPKVLLSTVAALPVSVQPVVAMLVNNVQGGVFGMASAIGWVLFVLIFTVYMILYKGLGFGKEE